MFAYACIFVLVRGVSTSASGVCVCACVCRSSPCSHFSAGEGEEARVRWGFGSTKRCEGSTTKT